MQSIRKAQKKDIPRVMELLGQVEMVHYRIRPDVFKYKVTKYTPEQLETLFEDAGKPVFVAVDEKDRVEGYAFCDIRVAQEHPLLQDGISVYIEDLCVDELCRGKHLGTALFEYVKDFAKRIGATSLTLNVWEGNDSALAFYEKQGMQVRSRIMEQKL